MAWCNRIVRILIPYTLWIHLFFLTPLFRKCAIHWIWLTYQSDYDWNECLYFMPIPLLLHGIYRDRIMKIYHLILTLLASHTKIYINIWQKLWQVSILPNTLNCECRHVLHIINVMYRKLCLIYGKSFGVFVLVLDIPHANFKKRYHSYNCTHDSEQIGGQHMLNAPRKGALDSFRTMYY